MIRRGQVFLANLDPVAGSEANKTRPVVIVSNQSANSRAAQLGRGVITVVPVTSNVTNVLAFQVALPAGEGGLTMASKIQAEQIRAIDVTRLGRHLGTITPQTLTKLNAAIRLHLAL